MKHPATTMTFTDGEVTKACNLHVDNLRKLITWRAVRPEQGGGGRGKVRLWSLKQAQRIAVTALITNAGLSLRMAHTLAHCLPLDDMLQAFDPDFISTIEDEEPRARLMAVFEEMPLQIQDDYDLVGHIKIVEGRYVFADVLGDDDTAFGEIDKERNVYLAYWDPFSSYYGTVSQGGRKKASPGALEVDRSSLLVENIGNRPKASKYVEVEDASYLTQINLNVGLCLATRRLLNLPIIHPLYGDRNEH